VDREISSQLDNNMINISFFQAEDGIRDRNVTGVQTCALPILKNLARLDVDMVTIHALGGGEMIAGAKEGLIAGSRAGKEPNLVAVTLLTSMDQTEMNNELGIK